MIKFDLYVRYDNDLSRIYFDDFVAQNDALFFGKRQTDYCVIFHDGSADKPYFKKSHLVRKSKEELCGLAFGLGLITGYSWHYRKADVVEIMMSVTNKNFYEWHYDAEYWRDLEQDFVICGYSQADYVAVKQVGGKKDFFTKDYLKQVFFGCPIDARLKIYQIECCEFMQDSAGGLVGDLYLDEYLTSIYEYDKDTLIANFEKTYQGEYKAKIAEFLRDKLPEYPDCD